MSPGEGTTGNNHPGASVMMPLAVASPHEKIRAQTRLYHKTIYKSRQADQEKPLTAAAASIRVLRFV
jgi:hypothetical protein